MSGRSEKKLQGLEICIVIAVVALAVGLYPTLDGESVNVTAIIVGFSVLVAAVLAAPLFAPVYVVWMRGASFLHLVVTPLVMGLVFFLVFTPISVVLRLMRVDLLNKDRRAQQQETHWRERNQDIPFDMRNQF